MLDALITPAALGEASLFYDLGLVLLMITILGMIGVRFKQPLIPIYLLVGVFIANAKHSFLMNKASIMYFSEMGIALLLFILGMELNFERLRDLFYVSVFGTTLQVAITFALASILMYVVGFSLNASIVIGLAIAFSSTALAVKNLVDMEQTDTLQGRISIGILLIQDLLIVIAMPLLSSLSAFTAYSFFIVLFKAVSLISIAIVLNKFIMRHLLSLLDSSPEMEFLFSLSVMFIFSTISHLLGFSIAIGGFLAGLTLAIYPYNAKISVRVSHLRDFFAVLFFVALGMNISIRGVMPYINYVLYVSAIALLLKPVIIALIVSLFGYDKRVAINVGINLGQISEFSLILGLYAISLGIIKEHILMIIASSLLLTSFISSYLLNWNRALALHLSKYLPLEKLNLKRKQQEEVEEKMEKARNHIIIAGVDTLGQSIIDKIDSKEVYLVDYNPEVIMKLKAMGYNAIYGDVSSEEFLKQINAYKAKIFISTIPEHTINTFLISTLKEQNRKMLVMVVANTIEEALKLYDAGADIVLLPKIASADRFARYINEGLEQPEALKATRIREIEYLERKKEEELINANLPDYLKELKEKILEEKIKQKEEQENEQEKEQEKEKNKGKEHEDGKKKSE